MTCEHCSGSHNGDYGSGRFCSAKCAKSFSTKEKRKEINEKVSLLLKGRTDLNNLTFEHFQAHARRMVAFHKAAFLLRFENWLKGDPDVSPVLAKKYLITLHGNKCQICDWAKVHPITGSVPVQIHHRDGNKKNNAKDNVELLCPNCHSLTPNFMNMKRPHIAILNGLTAIIRPGILAGTEGHDPPTIGSKPIILPT